jgi:hypothetical protein
MRYAMLADIPALPGGLRYPGYTGQDDESWAAGSVSREVGGGEIIFNKTIH